MGARLFVVSTLMWVVCAVGLLVGSAEAQTQEPSQADQSCQTSLLAAGVGSSSATAQVWVPMSREIRVHIGTPAVSVTSNGVQAKVLPSFPLFDSTQRSVWDGSRYQNTFRVNTVGPVTWTDRAVSLRGVCVSYRSAIKDFNEKR